MTLVSLQEISMIYQAKGSNPTHALQGISASIEEGKSYAITGASGSGKSTMLNIIAGILSPSSGRVSFMGLDISKMSDKALCQVRNKHIGLIVQDFALLEQNTVLENCQLPAIIAGKQGKRARERAMECLSNVGISALAKKKACQLSGGERQRVAIARALMNNPSLLLADEPTGSLDSKTADIILNLLLQQQKKGASLILVTHNEQFAMSCEQQIVLKDGQIRR